MTNKEFNDFYGFHEGMTSEERNKRSRQIQYSMKAMGNDNIDEDTIDSEAMADRYKEEEVDQQQHEYDLDVAKTDASFRYN